MDCPFRASAVGNLVSIEHSPTPTGTMAVLRPTGATAIFWRSVA